MNGSINRGPSNHYNEWIYQSEAIQPLNPFIQRALGSDPSSVGGGDPYRNAAFPVTVRRIDDTTWLYYFEEMVVGTASGME